MTITAKQMLGIFFIAIIWVWMIVGGGSVLGDVTDDAFFDARAGFLKGFLIRDFVPVIALLFFAFGSVLGVCNQYVLAHPIMHERLGRALILIGICVAAGFGVVLGISDLFDAYLQSLPTYTENTNSSYMGFFAIWGAGLSFGNISRIYFFKRTSFEEKSVSQS